MVGREDILNAIVDPGVVATACERISSDIWAVLQQWPDIDSQLSRKKIIARHALEIENANLNHRKSVSSASSTASIDYELEINQTILASTQSPQISLDSIGLMVVSGRPPSAPRIG